MLMDSHLINLDVGFIGLLILFSVFVYSKFFSQIYITKFHAEEGLRIFTQSALWNSAQMLRKFLVSGGLGFALALGGRSRGCCCLFLGSCSFALSVPALISPWVNHLSNMLFSCCDHTCFLCEDFGQ